MYIDRVPVRLLVIYGLIIQLFAVAPRVAFGCADDAGPECTIEQPVSCCQDPAPDPEPSEGEQEDCPCSVCPTCFLHVKDPLDVRRDRSERLEVDPDDTSRSTFWTNPACIPEREAFRAAWFSDLPPPRLSVANAAVTGRWLL
jgi:hypothetical protein